MSILPPENYLKSNPVSDAALCTAQSFLTRALMPLHKPKCVSMYHQQLAYCVTQARDCSPPASWVVNCSAKGLSSPRSQYQWLSSGIRHPPI